MNKEKHFLLKLHNVYHEVSENKYISNTVVMVCTIKAQIQPWKALTDKIRGQECLSKTSQLGGDWKTKERQRKVPQEDKLWGGRKKWGYNNVGHDDDSMAMPQIVFSPSSSPLAHSVELRQRKRWQAPSPHPPFSLHKSKISNICVMQLRQGSTGEETIKPC